MGLTGPVQEGDRCLGASAAYLENQVLLYKLELRDPSLCKGSVDFSEQNVMWPRISFDQSQYLDVHPLTNLLRFLDRVPLPNIYNTGNLAL